MTGLHGSAVATSELARPMNIVVILVDDLGWADLGCTGSTFYETPNVDALAADGIRFSNAYSASPVCSPTRAALMTGRHPVRVGITDWIRGFEKKDPPLATPQDRDELALEETTLAEALQEQGYATGYVGKWHLGETEAFWPEHQGFDVNIAGFSKGSPPGGYYSPYQNPRLADGPDGEYLTDRLTSEAIAFLNAHRDDPFFLTLAFYTVHTPIQGCAKWDDHFEEKRAALAGTEPDTTRPEGPAKTRLQQSDAKYAAMVRSMDENVGRLLAELDSLGIADNSIVVFTSDNGGLSTQPGRIAPTSVLPLRAGKGWCYEGGIRVPLIIRAPGKTRAGSITDQAAISMDLFPTLLELADVEPDPGLNLDGVSLVPALSDPQTTRPRTLVWHYPHYHSSGWTPGSAIRIGEWKLVEHYETGTLELYNLAEDPGETTDLALTHPRQLEQLKTALDAALAGMGGELPHPARREQYPLSNPAFPTED
jgi:arylsulfatase A-like enzyme